MFNPLFKIADAHLPAPVILFTTFGGLRGAVSLILAQMLVTQQDRLQKSGDMLQTAQVTCPSAFGQSVRQIYIYIYIYIIYIILYNIYYIKRVSVYHNCLHTSTSGSFEAMRFP